MSVKQMAECLMRKFRENKRAKISEVMEVLQIGRKECIEKVLLLNEQIKEYRYKILPGSSGKADLQGKSLPPTSSTYLLDSFSKAEYLYIVQTDPSPLLSNTSVIFFLGIFIILNESDIEEKSLITSLSLMQFTETELKDAISQKYFKRYTKEHIPYISLNWRFFFEFPDVDVRKYIRTIRTTLP
ncbi:hypothetical protein NEFER03_0891 [Nematocida sp. LUAm3]|nr:hypothetical protein NEFER03_0891 [Nematocida sp. LUAm3]KAI5174909.1 hypothetical protein NEFER02_1009 [Nematocida sp. LUAm2]KAI5177493.1 hypothetical protein NEFER01_0743 [Nematocida sp. LUAm1]